ncbi:MAG: hypothetical protein Q9190_002684 [Brigantiaea leucoxantha]
MRSTVEELPFLAGSVEPLSKNQPWLHDIHPHGAAYLEVKDLSLYLNFQDLQKNGFSPSLLDSGQLCPFPKAIYAQDGPAAICRIRANFVAGGLLLVISINHIVCDGRGITNVVKLFAQKLCQAQSGRTTSGCSANRTLISSFDRTSVLSSNGLPGEITHHQAWTNTPLPRHLGFTATETVCKTFYISYDSLCALKQAASHPSTATFVAAHISGTQVESTLAVKPTCTISTHDAVAALIWRSVILARHRAGILPDHSKTHFTQAVDCRSRLRLSPSYLGNAIYGVRTSLALTDLASAPEHDASQTSGLQTAALAIRKEVNSVTAEKFQGLLASIERTHMEAKTRLAGIEDFSIGSILLVSYYNFEIYDLDFGPELGDEQATGRGKVEAFRLPSKGLAPCVPVILPRLRNGGCEFIINEKEEVMGLLEGDKIFRCYTSR